MSQWLNSLPSPEPNSASPEPSRNRNLTSVFLQDLDNVDESLGHLALDAPSGSTARARIGEADKERFTRGFEKQWNTFHHWNTTIDDDEYTRGIFRDNGDGLDEQNEEEPLGKAYVAKLRAADQIRAAAGVSRDIIVVSENRKVIEWPDFRDVPGYEFCLPLTKNRQKFVQESRFIPYADEEAFPQAEYLLKGKFEWHGWSTLIDPNVEAIELETARRWMQNDHVSTDAIDRMDVLRPLYPKLEKPEPEEPESGAPLLHDYTEIDNLMKVATSRVLPGIYKTSGSKAPEMEVYEERPRGLFDCVAAMIPRFCPSLACLETECTLHHFERTRDMKELGLTTIIPKDTCPAQSCDKNCYTQHPDLANVRWMPKELDDVRDSFQIFPDFSSCDLAYCLDISCSTVQAIRRHLIYITVTPGPKPLSDLEALREAKETKDRINEHKRKLKRKRPSPAVCWHAGLACHDPAANCECTRVKRYCTRLCVCDEKCEFQWPGCNCKAGKEKLCTNCICKKNGRECEPHLCGCNVHELGILPADSDVFANKKSAICLNSTLQRQRNTLIKVQVSEWGLGAFVNGSKDLKSGSLVTEYLGEVMDGEEDDLAHHLLRVYSKRNYAFAGQKEDWIGGAYTSVDSAWMGNIARYLNHAEPFKWSKEGLPPPPPNCAAYATWVNGDHRLFFTTIDNVAPGEELLFNYGNAYWQHAAPAGRQVLDMETPETETEQSESSTEPSVEP